jgi:type IV secretory pathway TraG/TraD family ATPase VirD4
MENPNHENLITVFAKTNFRNKEVPFGIKTDDRRRHMYLVGKTGMGKTTLMENMVIQDIKNGHGVAFLDPHGDSIQRILNSIPNSRVNDVIYFNPADLDYPVAFNILESVDPKYKHLVASGLMGVFTKIWANLWSARMEYILNNTILALLDSPGNTLLGITRMYVDKKYRKKIVDNVKDPMVRAFWTDEFANYNEKYRTEAIAPIQNKVGQFLSSGIIRNIVGQPKSTIDLREVMDQNKILIMDLSKGRVGEDNSALLGAMIVTKLQLAAMSRTDILEKERKDFYLYVDEFQNFATDSFATILSEARKYRLNLIVGHQYIGQLVQERNTKVRDAIFGNVGTLVVFRVGAEDAEFLVKEFEPIFTEVDIVNLPKYHILLKLMINGVASDPFFSRDHVSRLKLDNRQFGKKRSKYREKDTATLSPKWKKKFPAGWEPNTTRMRPS